jgi:hypothetical protein
MAGVAIVGVVQRRGRIAVLVGLIAHLSFDTDVADARAAADDRR